MHERRVTTPHGTVAVVDHGGDGPDVLLLHGGGRTLADWGLVRPHLSERRVVAFDLRWQGLSSDEGDVSLEANADDVEAVIDALGLDNPVVVGHSLGGMVAAVYGTRRPDCTGVANLDGHDRGTPDDYDGIGVEEVAAFRRQLEERASVQAPIETSGDDAWHDAAVSKMTDEMRGWGLHPSLVHAVAARSFVRAADGTWNRRPNPRHLVLLLPTLESLRMFDVYRSVECPLLIYHCTRVDRIDVPRADEVLHAYHRGLSRRLEMLEAERPNVRVKTLDVGHMVMFEIPGEVAGDILSLTPLSEGGQMRSEERDG